MSKVIACIDASPSGASVSDHAAWAALSLGAPLELLHVLDRHPERAATRDLSGSIGLGTRESLLDDLASLDEQRGQLAQEQGRQLLEGAKQRAAAFGVQSVDVRQRHGSLVDTLLELEADARLFVLGQHHQAPRLSRIHLDHNIERVVRTVHQPVLVTQASFKVPERFGIAFDGSATGRKMVETLARSPLLRGLPCRVVMVGDETASVLDQGSWARTKLSENFAVDVSFVSGEPDAALLKCIDDHDLDLLVMGAYGHTRIRELIVGSTTTTMLRTSRVPLLVLR